jgi:uncharacterized protein
VCHLASALLIVKSVRLSRFVLVLRDVAPGEHVLYDIIADRYAGVDGPTLEAIGRWSAASPAGEDESRAAAELAALRFVVRDRAEDDARLEEHRAAIAEGMPGTLYVTLIPTLACDLACSYCFQRDHPAAGRMSTETEAAALAWIEREAVASGARRLLLHFIGGEALLCKDFLARTARSLRGALGARGIDFAWELTTNGVGLTPAIVRRLSEHGPGAVKVTLDGDRPTHDAARVSRDGRGTFDRIFEALLAVARECPEVELRVGGNLRQGAGARASASRLLDRFEAAGLRGRLEWVRFKPVIDLDAGCGRGCGADRADADDASREAFARGLTRTATLGIDAVTPCEVHWRRSYVIDTAGRLYRCLAVAGRPELALGTVHDGALAPDPLVVGRPWERCGDCPFVPACMGGCLGGRYLVTGRAGEIACERPALEARFRAEIGRRYLEEFHPGGAEAAPAVSVSP